MARSTSSNCGQLALVASPSISFVYMRESPPHNFTSSGKCGVYNHTSGRKIITKMSQPQGRQRRIQRKDSHPVFQQILVIINTRAYEVSPMDWDAERRTGPTFLRNTTTESTPSAMGKLHDDVLWVEIQLSLFIMEK